MILKHKPHKYPVSLLQALGTLFRAGTSPSNIPLALQKKKAFNNSSLTSWKSIGLGESACFLSWVFHCVALGRYFNLSDPLFF